jgi:hypothetical protein
MQFHILLHRQIVSLKERKGGGKNRQTTSLSYLTPVPKDKAYGR